MTLFQKKKQFKIDDSYDISLAPVSNDLLSHCLDKTFQGLQIPVITFFSYLHPCDLKTDNISVMLFYFLDIHALPNM